MFERGILSQSSIFVGAIVPMVSGSNRARKPAVKAKDPNSNIGRKSPYSI